MISTKGVKNMLDINPVLLLVTGTVFLILLVVLNKSLYQPLIAFIDNRNSAISRDLENAGKNASDVAAHYKAVEAILADGRIQASKIKEAAMAEAKEKALQKVEQKKVELENRNVAFSKALKTEKAEFKSHLLSQMPLFKDGITHKLNHI